MPLSYEARLGILERWEKGLTERNEWKDVDWEEAKASLGEWALGEIKKEISETNSYYLFYYDIAIACLGKQKVEKRLQDVKKNG